MPGPSLGSRRRRGARLPAALAALTAGLLATGPLARAAPDYPATLQAIARDIAALKDQFPQLADFSPSGNARPETLVIDYAFRTYRPQSQDGRPRGGWTSGVPNPVENGIWFYINFHDPDSVAQIDTQPAGSHPCLGQKRVTFLILEGKETKPLAARIGAILERHGVKPCD